MKTQIQKPKDEELALDTLTFSPTMLEAIRTGLPEFQGKGDAQVIDELEDFFNKDIRLLPSVMYRGSKSTS